jgi:NADH-quinone oxidoreductase subunit N
VLVAFLAGGSAAIEAATFYLAAYALASLAAFGLIGALSGRDGEPESVKSFEGLLWTRPWLALVLAAALLSLIGLPLTGGFWGKFMVVAAGAKSGLWVLLVALALNSAVGLYYYLRILLAACRPVAAPLFHPLCTSDGLMLGGVTVLSLLLGVFPAPVFDLIRSLVAAGVP